MKTRADNNNGSRWSKHINGVLLGVLLVFVAPKFYDLHRNAHISYKSGASIEWFQPTALNDTFPTPITNGNWRFNFTNIERLLWKSKTSESGKLIVNSDTLDLLEQTANLLPQAFTQKQSKRLTFLIRKSVPGQRGQQLSTLFKQYQLYQQDHQANLLEISQAPASRQLELLKANELKRRARQEQYFGSGVAPKLFRKSNISTRYFNQRRIISLTKGLTKAERKERLDALKEVYKAALTHYADE